MTDRALIASLGGYARAVKLTPERQAEISRQANAARWSQMSPARLERRREKRAKVRESWESAYDTLVAISSRNAATDKG